MRSRVIVECEMKLHFNSTYISQNNARTSKVVSFDHSQLVWETRALHEFSQRHQTHLCIFKDVGFFVFGKLINFGNLARNHIDSMTSIWLSISDGEFRKIHDGLESTHLLLNFAFHSGYQWVEVFDDQRDHIEVVWARLLISEKSLEFLMMAFAQWFQEEAGLVVLVNHEFEGSLSLRKNSLRASRVQRVNCSFNKWVDVAKMLIAFCLLEALVKLRLDLLIPVSH